MIIAAILYAQASYCQDDPEALAKKLIADARTDREKVESIFHWITDNISYTIFPKHRTPFVPIAEANDDGPLKPLNERVARDILKRKTALCDGYARLFKTLCDHAGIPAEIIQGYAQSWNISGPRFGVNHYWNAVFFDGNWHLLDATWASGYVNWKGDEFIKDYESSYFLSSPEQFIKDHYPDDPRWTLLPDTKVPDEFRYSPFKQKSFSKYKITSFFPSTGIINANLGDTLHFKLETGDLRGRDIGSDLDQDPSIFLRSPEWAFVKPMGNKSPSNQYEYTYTIESSNVQWLYLLYNDDLILKYKINVNERNTPK